MSFACFPFWWVHPDLNFNLKQMKRNFAGIWSLTPLSSVCSAVSISSTVSTPLWQTKQVTFNTSTIVNSIFVEIKWHIFYIRIDTLQLNSTFKNNFWPPTEINFIQGSVSLDNYILFFVFVSRFTEDETKRKKNKFLPGWRQTLPFYKNKHNKCGIHRDFQNIFYAGIDT